MVIIKHCLLLGVLAATVAAQTLNSPSSDQGTIATSGKFSPTDIPPVESPAELKKALEVHQVSDHLFAIGNVRFNQQERTVSIPAKVNMRQGAVEYALVGERGKTHESIFVTSVMPQQVHTACLLLGIEPKQIQIEPDQPFQLPRGTEAAIEVTWEKHGPAACYPLGALVLDNESDREAKVVSHEWWYNGSRFAPEGFVAQQEHSFVALISDGGALMNDPRALKLTKDDYYPNAALLPKEGTAVKIILKFTRKP